MRMTRALAVLGVVSILGSIRVAQQTAIRLQGYALGRQTLRAHELENQHLWLRAEVMGLESPARLAKTLSDSKTKFVARTTLPAVPRGAQLADAGDVPPGSVSD